MHTFSYGDWSINYNSDLSGTAIITKDGGWKIHMPCELLKEFVERLGNDHVEAMRERAEMAESANARNAKSLTRSLAAAHELRKELRELREEYHRLIDKALPPAQAIRYMERVRAIIPQDPRDDQAVAAYISELAEHMGKGGWLAPKRKTRLEAAMEASDVVTDWPNESVVRNVLVEAGVDPDEELPEST